MIKTFGYAVETKICDPLHPPGTFDFAAGAGSAATPFLEQFFDKSVVRSTSSGHGRPLEIIAIGHQLTGVSDHVCGWVSR